MKKIVFIFCLILQYNAFAQEGGTSLSISETLEIQVRSDQMVASEEACDTILNDHIAIVDASERYIAGLAAKKSEDITQFEIAELQKIITNRFIHLKKTQAAYSDADKVKGCSPAILGEAVSIYDFTLLGNTALKMTALRRILNNFAKYPKYQLTGLRKMYSHYTSSKVIDAFLEELNEEKITLPNNLNIDRTIEDGKFTKTSDVAVKGATSIISGAAKLWGFISDELAWRNGRLNKDEVVLNTVKSNLKPLDLIFEKRTYVLSNYTIPGHWGHVAVWLGTKDELIALGVWDKEFFKPFREAVEAGKNIVEIRKKGMQFVSLEDFINLDEIAVTRIKNAMANSEQIFSDLVDEMDAAYDFEFNAQTPDKLTCSEMIAYSYGDIHWPEMKTFLQVSLRPDDTALLSLYKNSPEEFILYIKGEKDKPAEQKTFEDWKQLFSENLKEGELVYQ